MDEQIQPVQAIISRRSLGRAVPLLGGAALGAVVAADPAEAATSPWSLTGNPRTTSANFLGTTDNASLAFRTKNAERIRITAAGNVGVGTANPTARLHVVGAKGANALSAVGNAQVGGSLTATGSMTAGLSLSVGAAAVVGASLSVGASLTVGAGLAVGASAAVGANLDVGKGVTVDGDGTFGGNLKAQKALTAGGNGTFGGNLQVQKNFLAGGTLSVKGAGTFSDHLTVLNGLTVKGPMAKAGGSFRIDHPLDPAGKYLSHSFVESPDMKNIYDGVAVADSQGRASVTMPDWFDALNRDFRYQLTALGAPARDLHIATELRDRTFSIAGANPGQRISWQVTGTRQDAWANAHRIPIETRKTGDERGRYLFPELFGAAPSQGIGAPQADGLTPVG